jgi:hypothetical protein
MTNTQEFFIFAALILIGFMMLAAACMFLHGIKRALVSGCKSFHKKLTSRENLLVQVPKPPEDDQDEEQYINQQRKFN